MQILLIILCLLLPPVAVFLKRGPDMHFFLSIVLTIIFFVPGVIHALYVVLAAEGGKPV